MRKEGNDCRLYFYLFKLWICKQQIVYSLKISHFPYNQSDMSVFVLSCESIFFFALFKNNCSLYDLHNS